MRTRSLLLSMLTVVAMACGTAAPDDGDEPLRASGRAGLLGFELSFDAPPAVGALDGEIVVTRDGAPVTGADVWVAAHMASHTHGASEVRAEEAGGGRYRVTGLDASMAGEWQVEIDAVTPDGEDDAVFEVYVE